MKPGGFTPVAVNNPYKSSQYRAGRGGDRGRGGRDDRGGRGFSRMSNPHPKQEAEPFLPETVVIVERIVNREPNTTVSETDFGDITDPRDNFRAILYGAAEQGYRMYIKQRNGRTSLVNGSSRAQRN